MRKSNHHSLLLWLALSVLLLNHNAIVAASTARSRPNREERKNKRLRRHVSADTIVERRLKGSKSGYGYGYDNGYGYGKGKGKGRGGGGGGGGLSFVCRSEGFIRENDVG